MTDADRIEYLTNQLRYYRDLSIRLNQEIQASRNTPERQNGRGLHRDPTGNTASYWADKQRKRRN